MRNPNAQKANIIYTKDKVIIMQEVRSHPYVIQDERISGGSAVIKGTRTRVVDIAIEYEYLVHSPDEIISAHPHLTLPQIHDALSYYYENMEEIDGKIKEEQEFVKGLRKIFQGQNLCRLS
jgi:uncharacterized protein (DUF433 family)